METSSPSSWEEEELQQLRSNATQLLLCENWKDYISLYSNFISLHQYHLSPSSSSCKIRKHLLLALSNRAEAHHRLGQFHEAIEDCDLVLGLDPNHRKSLLCKGKIMLDLDRYTSASVCFRKASDSVLLDRCRRLEAQAKNGSLDISDWVLSGFRGEPPEMAEYVGPVEIRRSENGGCGGRGLFATRNVDVGTPLFVNKAVVIGRAILPEKSGDGSGSDGRFVMWKDFVDRILEAVAKCRRTLQLIYTLSTGEEEESIGSEIPNTGHFKPEENQFGYRIDPDERPDTSRILKILDVNCLTGDAISSGNLGRKSGTSDCTVGLWTLASFLNHSCHPNARRVHIGDRVIVHASRDVKAGEELTFAYFDVLQPLPKRKELAAQWGFHCQCSRCSFEEKVWEDLRPKASSPAELEEWMAKNSKKWAIKGKEKGFLRASIWGEYVNVYVSERLIRNWGRKLPTALLAAESVAAVVGGDVRVLKVVVNCMRTKDGNGFGLGEEMEEKVIKLGRGVYGKIVKKKSAIRALLCSKISHNSTEQPLPPPLASSSYYCLVNCCLLTSNLINILFVRP